MAVNTPGTVAVVALVLLAGCTGFNPAGSTVDGPTASDNPTEPSVSESFDDASTGVLQFYISDEKNAIDDFEHLTVTISKIGIHRVGENVSDDRDDDTETATPNTTQTVTNTTANSSTATITETVSDNSTPTATASATGTVSPTPETEETDNEDSESETPEEGENSTEEGDGEFDESDNWITYEVDNRTVDLTELKGENASLLEAFDVPSDSYNKVFVFVSSINATLTTGDSVNVKLPSERLHINDQFSVGANESVDFVFDIAVFKAGNSGKYILKPVISESGTDVPFKDVTEKRNREVSEQHRDTNAQRNQSENNTRAEQNEGPDGEDADRNESRESNGNTGNGDRDNNPGRNDDGDRGPPNEQERTATVTTTPTELE